MKRIIERLKEVRSESAGFTLVEALVYTMLVSVLSVMALYIMTSSTNLHRAFGDREMSVNQGVVADKVTELYEAAQQYKEDFPNRPLTKQALVEGGYIVMPDSYTWTVARYGLNSSEVCAVAYSTTEQTDKYTAENPAEYSTQYQLKAQWAPGCWHRNADKKLVPDWNQADAFPQSVWSGTDERTTLLPAG